VADEIVTACQFGREQERAFRIIVDAHTRSIESQSLLPLRMNISGSGGTGKSTVIHAVKDYFRRVGQSDKLKMCSFTGVASKNVDGNTLHSALSLRCDLNSSKNRTELRNRWEKVQYLFVDEVSMIGCRLLARVGEALCI
ncbi:hypothetical protein BJ165DRAFT_1304684, partial [Panaeolus papilionaceus]